MLILLRHKKSRNHYIQLPGYYSKFFKSDVNVKEYLLAGDIVDGVTEVINENWNRFKVMCRK